MIVNSDTHKNGFTLIELIVAVLVLGILAAIVIPMYTGYIEKARAASDKHALGVLNDVTRVYYAEEPSPNPFEVFGTSSDALMQTLVDTSLLSEKPEPQQKDASFIWDFDNEVWLLSGSHELSSDEITFGNGWFENAILASDFGQETDIVIPESIDSVTISAIYQDAFKDKNLTSVTFAANSSIVQIHARAFMDNDLTEIILPSGLQRLDYGAFLDNDITKITIGSGVALESNVFRGNDQFKTVYYAQGAGTYIYTDDQWVKQ